MSIKCPGRLGFASAQEFCIQTIVHAAAFTWNRAGEAVRAPRAGAVRRNPSEVAAGTEVVALRDRRPSPFLKAARPGPPRGRPCPLTKRTAGRPEKARRRYEEDHRVGRLRGTHGHG